MNESEKLSARITDYLSSGGLFNPECAKHDKVRDLLIECRAELSLREKVEEEAPDTPCEQCAHGDIEIHPRKHGLVHCRYKSQTKSHHGTCSDWKAKSEKVEKMEDWTCLTCAHSRPPAITPSDSRHCDFHGMVVHKSTTCVSYAKTPAPSKPAERPEIETLCLPTAYSSGVVLEAIANKLNEIIKAVNAVEKEMRKR